MHIWATYKDTKSMGEDIKILISIKDITLLPAVDAAAEEEKQQKLSENENFIPRQELNALVTQWIPFGKTLWAFYLPQRKDTAIHWFWQGSGSLFLHHALPPAPSYYNPLVTVPGSSTQGVLWLCWDR